MTDLHTHILPGIDDGARDLETSLELLALERADGVDELVCTPHCDLQRESLEHFLQRRKGSARLVAMACMRRAPGIHLRLGAEVRLFPALAEQDVVPLCIQKTKVLLVEMPWAFRPVWDTRSLKQLTLAGVTPLVAHVERYPFIQRQPEILLEWAAAGAFLQVNAASLTGRPELRELTFRLLRHRLAHVVASDTHSPDRRPPDLASAMDLIARRMGSERADRLNANANALFWGIAPSAEEPVPFSRRFWRGV